MNNKDKFIQEQYHPIERILNDFNKGNTYSDTIEKIQSLISHGYEEGLKDGKKEADDALQHATQMLIDGFSHPVKSCERCIFLTKKNIQNENE